MAFHFHFFTSERALRPSHDVTSAPAFIGSAGGPLPHVVTLDFARGAMALAVMFYHVLSRELSNRLSVEMAADIERVAYYAVYSFFVISGFALYASYHDRMRDSKDIASYLVRRFFRIAPLFYLAVAIRLWLSPSQTEVFYKTIMNLSFTFGLASPGNLSMITGGWSIGVEIVFYLLFPLILAVCARCLRRLWLLSGICIVLSSLFVNYTLRGYHDMTTAWVPYTQPIAFLAYFVSGCLLGELFRRHPAWIGLPIFKILTVAALVPFCLFRVGSPLDLLRGGLGLTLMLSTMIFVGSVAFLRAPVGNTLVVAQAFGVLSYPIYLLHPLVHQLVIDSGVQNTWLRVLTVFVGTPVLAFGVHRLIERPARLFGRNLAGL